MRVCQRSNDFLNSYFQWPFVVSGFRLNASVHLSKFNVTFQLRRQTNCSLLRFASFIQIEFHFPFWAIPQYAITTTFQSQACWDQLHKSSLSNSLHLSYPAMHQGKFWTCYVEHNYPRKCYEFWTLMLVTMQSLIMTYN